MKIVNLVLFGLLFFGCKPNDVPIYHYGDKVKVREGFYKNSEGEMLALFGCDPKCVYFVFLKKGNTTNSFYESNLEPIK